MPETVLFLMDRYGLSEEGAREVLAEMPESKSLRSLACYRIDRGARAVSAPTPPTDL